MSDPREPTLPEWLRLETFAASLEGVTPVQARQWAKAGKIRARQFGKLWFVHRSEVEAYDAERERAKRGDVVPAEPGQALGSIGDDAGWAPEVSVREVEGGRGTAAPGTHQATGRERGGGSAKPEAWIVPGEMAR